MTLGARHAVIFLFVLSMVLAAANLLWTSRQVGTVARTSVTIAQIHATQISACELGNDYLAREVTLWDHLIAISHPPAGASPEVRRADAATLASLRAYIGRVFAPRNCQALYRL